MSATDQYVEALTRLKAGELGLLRTHAGLGLDESVDGFDLFAGIWWPLREKNERAPRREVAWLIAKLYAFCPIMHSPGDYFACQLGRCQPNDERERRRYQGRFDQLLILAIEKIEPALQLALHNVASKSPRVDWVKLTDDLSIWERETTRRKWAEQFLQINERTRSC